MGRPAFFIRTFGCPQHCPWCDSAGTWHPDYVPEKVAKMHESDLVQEMLTTPAAFAVITGGEPAIHDLRLLTATLHDFNLKAHLETSGAYALRGTFDWITLSPKNKWAKPFLPEVLALAHEIKLVIEHPDDLPYWAQLLTRPEYHGQPIWLHVEWSKRNDPKVLEAITEYVKHAGDPWRAGYQLHKLFRADTFDNRSATPAPLGGNPSLGF